MSNRSSDSSKDRGNTKARPRSTSSRNSPPKKRQFSGQDQSRQFGSRFASNDNKIFVSGLDGTESMEDLRSSIRGLFEARCTIESIDVKRSHNGEYSFAFLVIKEADRIDSIIKDLNSVKIGGRRITVQRQKPKAFQRRRSPEERAPGNCYRCGKAGHFARSCSRSPEEKTGKSKPKKKRNRSSSSQDSDDLKRRMPHRTREKRRKRHHKKRESSSSSSSSSSSGSSSSSQDSGRYRHSSKKRLKQKERSRRKEQKDRKGAKEKRKQLNSESE